MRFLVIVVVVGLLFVVVSAEKETHRSIHQQRIRNSDKFVGYVRPRQTEVTHWEKRKIYYSFLSYSCCMSRKLIRREVKIAFKRWEKVAGLRFVRVGDRELAADITISFVRGNHGDSYSFPADVPILAHAFFPETGELHFNDDIKWTVENGPGKHSVEEVAVHELGHILGLNHSNTSNAMMFPFYKDEMRIAYDDDIKRMQQLYGYPFNDKSIPEKVQREWTCFRYSYNVNRYYQCKHLTAIVGGLFNRIYLFDGDDLSTYTKHEWKSRIPLIDAFGQFRSNVRAAVLKRKKRHLHIYAGNMHYAYYIKKDEKFRPVSGYPKPATAPEKEIIGSIEYEYKNSTKTVAILPNGMYAKHIGDKMGRRRHPLDKLFPNMPTDVIAAIPADEPYNLVVFTKKFKVYQYDQIRKKIICGPKSAFMYLKCLG